MRRAPPSPILLSPILPMCVLVVACSRPAHEAEAVDPSVPTRLRFGTAVRSILEDRSGRLWFGSWNEGAACLEDGRWTYFSALDGLSDNQVRSIHEAPDGSIWFECGVGLSRFDGDRLVVHADRDRDAVSAWRLEPGDLWFKGDAAIGPSARERVPGVHRFDGDRVRFLELPLPEPPGGPNLYSLTDTARIDDARIWLATYAMVLGFDGETFTTYDAAGLGIGVAPGDLHVRSVHEDRAGRLWIGNNGIGVVLVEDGRVTRFSDEHGVGAADAAPGVPTLDRVFSIGEDRNGDVWFGTIEFGAWRWDGETLRRFGPDDGLESREVQAITTDRSGVLWLGAGDPSGVYRLDGERFVRTY